MQVFKPCDGNDFLILFFPSVFDAGSKLAFLGFPNATKVDPTDKPEIAKWTQKLEK